MSQPCLKCDEGWICEAHPGESWPHEGCGGAGMPCREKGCSDTMLTEEDRKRISGCK